MPFKFQMCSQPEKNSIDSIIDSGPQTTGDMDYRVVLGECIAAIFGDVCHDIGAKLSKTPSALI